jgi:hypothetical protein
VQAEQAPHQRRPRDARLNDRAWLEARYVIDGLTMAQIGTLLGCSADVVRNALVRHDIARRRPGGTRSMIYPELYDVAWLRARYEQDRWSYRRIAREVGCSFALVQYAIARAGIAPRSTSGHDDRAFHGSRGVP